MNRLISSGSAKSSRGKEQRRRGKQREREEESVGSSTRVVLSVQKPQPRFHVRVQTGRGEQPLDVWRIGVVHRVYTIG